MHEGVQREQEKLVVHKGEMREQICIDTAKAAP